MVFSHENNEFVYLKLYFTEKNITGPIVTSTKFPMPQKFVLSYAVDITIATCIDSVYAQMMFQCVQCIMHG